MIKPICVLISDIHYSLPTLELADAAVNQAIVKANELGVPLIVAGDLHDTKANLRGECVKAMLDTFELCKTRKIILIGNHDKINEKSVEHSLSFLEYSCTLVTDGAVQYDKRLDLYLIGYQHDLTRLRVGLKQIPKGSTIIMHQGIQGSNSGDYIQDKSAINKEDVAGRRVISGHYHSRQTINLPEGGTWDYIGNPYTLNFGEANDPPKGFQILMDDGTLEFVPTNLRKHVKMHIDVIDGFWEPNINPSDIIPSDLLWVTMSASKQYLSTITKDTISYRFKDSWPTDFKLTLEPTDLNIKAPTKTLVQGELLDSLIDSIDTNPETKSRLKTTWKSLCGS